MAELETPIGMLRLAASSRGLVKLGLPRSTGTGFAGWLDHACPGAEVVESNPDLEQAQMQLTEYFAGTRREFKLNLDLRGTEFQLRVWREVISIPFGEQRTYGEVARAVGGPRAFRAVGAANGANPLPLIVPCHRVVAANGKLGGYGGGLDTKRRLLAFEQTAAPSRRLA